MRRRPSNLALLLVLSTLCLPVLSWADEDGWTLEKDEDGTQIHSRAVDGWEIREIRGRARFEGRLSSLVAVLEDGEAAPRLNEFVEHWAVLHRDSDTRYQVYAQTDMPWPLKDRDVVMQREISQDAETGVVTIKDNAVPDVEPEKKGLVRIVRSHQTWTLTPNADGTVSIELRMLSDPAGPIPSALINALSVGTPFKTIAELKALAQEPRYAEAQVAFVSDK